FVRGFEVNVDGATHESARAGNVLYRFAAAKTPERFSLALIQARTTRRRQRIETIGKCLAPVADEIIFDFAKERLRKVLQLLLSHARNSAKLSRSRRIISRHFTKRNIGKDNVG